jgi:hypothetical protein
LPVPDTLSTAPNTVNSTMYVAATSSGTPKIPSSVMYSVPTIRDGS